MSLCYLLGETSLLPNTFCGSETPWSFHFAPGSSQSSLGSFLIMLALWTFSLPTAQGRNSLMFYLSATIESDVSHTQKLPVSHMSLHMVELQMEHGDSYFFREFESPCLSIYWFISCDYMQSVSLIRTAAVSGWSPNLIIKGPSSFYIGIILMGSKLWVWDFFYFLWRNSQDTMPEHAIVT